MCKIGYEFGGVINASTAIIYGKTGTKTRTSPARILITENGLVLKLYLSKIDTHCQYVESIPPYTKDIFAGEIGDCNKCSFRDGRCKYGCTKTYMIEGRLKYKCGFMIINPRIENFTDYISLILEFFVSKKLKV